MEDLDPFVYRMMKTFHRVHNEKYWRNIDPFLAKINKGIFLDVGCGPGLLLKELAERYNPMSVIGIDLSADMLKKAEEVLASEKEKRTVELIQQHMQQNWNLPKGIDAIFSSRVLRSFEDQYVILKSFHESLKKNGYLIVLDWERQPIHVYESWFAKQPDFNELSPNDIMKYHRNFSRYSIEDWMYIMEHTGFTMIRAFRINEVHIGFVAQKQDN